MSILGQPSFAFIEPFEEAVRTGDYARAATVMSRAVYPDDPAAKLPFGAAMLISWIFLHTPIGCRLADLLLTVPPEICRIRAHDGPATDYAGIVGGDVLLAAGSPQPDVLRRKLQGGRGRDPPGSGARDPGVLSQRGEHRREGFSPPVRGVLRGLARHRTSVRIQRCYWRQQRLAMPAGHARWAMEGSPRWPVRPGGANHRIDCFGRPVVDSMIVRCVSGQRSTAWHVERCSPRRERPREDNSTWMTVTPPQGPDRRHLRAPPLARRCWLPLPATIQRSGFGWRVRSTTSGSRGAASVRTDGRRSPSCAGNCGAVSCHPRVR